jgi:glycosidase
MVTARLLLVLALLVAMPQIDGTLLAVQVDLPSGPVQPHSGCTSGTADFCGLRIYQVMVESFVDGDPNRDYNDGYGTSHHKGDLRGIIDSLDYIQGLGLNAIWMTPIFNSHAGQSYEWGGTNLKLDATGYYTRNYFEIDPKFGSLADAQELVDTAHEMGMHVFFDGVFGHHKGNLVASPTGKLPVNSSPGFVDYDAPATLDFYKEVATYWIEELGIDGWRLDQSYQVPPDAWREIRMAVEDTSAQRALAGEQWGTLGYMVAEDWNNNPTIVDRTYGPDSDPVLHSAFDFMVRYAILGVVASEENPAMSNRPATVISENWAYGAHDNVLPSHAVPNLMLGNHDTVRFGDLLQRAGIADPDESEYWARHRLAFMFQAAYSGPITRYYGEEIGDEVPNYANQVTSNCANLGLCDDHVGRTSAKILGVTVDEQDLSTDSLDLIQFHQDVMAVRAQYPALSHGERQHIFSDNDLYVDLKTFEGQQIVFAMNVGDQALAVQLNESLFSSSPQVAWDILTNSPLPISGGYLDFVLPPLSGSYILLLDVPPNLPGDYNNNGEIDAADYAVWRDAMTAGSTSLVNDPTPGVVDESDFGYWRDHFGEVLGGGDIGSAAAVPEPSTRVILLIGALALFSRPRSSVV